MRHRFSLAVLAVSMSVATGCDEDVASPIVDNGDAGVDAMRDTVVDDAGPDGSAGDDTGRLGDAGAADAAGDAGEPAPVDPGRITIRRLNRAEYNNTVQALFGTAQAPADDFPDDDHGYGFDNIADVLSISPLHLEMYAIAAASLVDEALDVPLQAPISVHHEAELATASVGAAANGGMAWNLWSNGTVQAVAAVPGVVWASQAGDEIARAALLVDEVPVATFDVTATSADAPQVVRTVVELDEGSHFVGVAFLNDYYDADAGADRNLYVDAFALNGPTDFVLRDNPLRTQLVTCEPTPGDYLPCVRSIVGEFAARAWRRPVEAAELDRLMRIAESVERMGDDFDLALSYTLQAVLLSPHFVYRVEIDPEPTSLEARALTDWELATRLSYFLWSSMPDDELFELAAAGQLQDDDVLRAQVERMLDDPRSHALVDNFAGQWLYIRALDEAAPDPWAYPGFSEELRASMRREMELFFESFIEEDRSLLDLLLADDTFVDGRLAQHYGLEGIVGADFERAVFSGVPRGGLLGQAGLLTALSYPGRTSPVRRGKFVLGQLLCREPEPPPPGVEGLPETEEMEGLPLRERMAIHMSDPDCSVCHATMDPLGFALEHYDGLGAWRDAYPDGEIDATGELPDGSTFDGAREMAAVIAADPGYARCVTTKLYTYALGRAPGRLDGGIVLGIADGFAADGYRFRDLVTRIVLSDTFRMRRGEPAPESEDTP